MGIGGDFTDSTAGAIGPARRPHWRLAGCGALLAAAAAAAYCRTFPVPFFFDDLTAIVQNATLRHWSTVLQPPADTTTSGRPLLNLTFAANHAISGLAVWSYHALNLAIHVLAGLALFGVVRRTLERGKKPSALFVAFAAALLWTLHPLQTESVTYVVQRAESLTGLFYLLTLYCFIRGADVTTGNTGGTEKSRGGIQGSSWPQKAQGIRSSLLCVLCGENTWLFLSVISCLLGMACKEVMVTAPVAVLLYDRTFVAGSFGAALRRRRWYYLALATTWIPLAFFVAGTGWNRGGTSGFNVGISPRDYWLTQPEAICRYVWLSFWPHPLVFDYGPVGAGRAAAVAACGAAVGALAFAVLVALRRRMMPGFLGAWFFLNLAPTSIMPGRIQMIVEHRMYLPLAAAMVLVAAGVYLIFRRWRWIALGALAVALGLVTARRNEDYRNTMGLWEDTVVKCPGNVRARYNVGTAWLETPGRLGAAVAQFREALRLRPDYVAAHSNLGVALSRMPGRLADAIAEYETALRLDPGCADAHMNLGNALMRLPGRIDDAIAHYREALRLEPGSARAHADLAGAWAQLPERLADAKAEYEAALRIEPGCADYHTSLGAVLAQMPGRLGEAVAQYQEALRLNPNSVEAHDNLGLALAQIPGRLLDAIAEHEAALRLRPDYAPAWHNLGAAWYHQGNLEAAASAFRAELKLSPDDPAAREALETVLERMRRR